jgi:DNA-binding NarL/FixJ family response regulator
MIRVLIADDHALVRSAISDLLADTDDIRVVAECLDGCDVVEAAARTRPDVVLMDLSMPVMDGLEATRALADAQPDARVIVLTASPSVTAVRTALALGVCGFLVKGEDDSAALPGHIRAVARGGTAWTPSAARLMPSASRSAGRGSR